MCAVLAPCHPSEHVPVLPRTALPELVTSFLSSLEYFTSEPGLSSSKILTLSEFRLRSELSSSVSCSFRNFVGMQSVRCFRKLWGYLARRLNTSFSLLWD